MNENEKRKRAKVSIEHSAQIRVLYQCASVRGKKLYEMFPQYSKSSICVHMKKPIGGEPVFDKRKLNQGRPQKLSEKENRRVGRTVPRLRASDGSFSSPRIQVVSGTEHVDNRTVRRSLNRQGFRFRTTRKKGVLKASDLPKRLRFCRKVRRLKLGKDFWRKGVSFYLDGKGFAFKTNPLDQAKSPRAKEWIKDGEGLSLGCTAKGSKEGVRNANFMVSIAYNRGVVMCEQYFGTITGAKFASIVRTKFPESFAKCEKPCSRRLLMDNCTRQNSKVARAAMLEVGAMRFRIPARSPDLNPIENFFHVAGKELRRRALQLRITKESFEEFSLRCVSTMQSFSVQQINNIIDSMDKRIGLVIKSKGQRIKY